MIKGFSKDPKRQAEEAMALPLYVYLDNQVLKQNLWKCLEESHEFEQLYSELGWLILTCLYSLCK